MIFYNLDGINVESVDCNKTITMVYIHVKNEILFAELPYTELAIKQQTILII